MPALHIEHRESHVEIFIEDHFFSMKELLIEKGVDPSKIKLSHHSNNNN
jgi:predicted metal-dependent phosphotriesterase family hydrolase